MKKRGTSLIELLAVIVIIGIITAVAVPTVGSLVKNVRKKACVASMESIVQSCYYITISGEKLESNISEVDDIFKECGGHETLNHRFKDICSSKGEYTYSIDDEIIIVSCTVHNESVSYNADQLYDMIIKGIANSSIIREYLLKNGNRIDSGSVNNQKTQELLQSIKDATGIEVSSQADTWTIKRTGNYKDENGEKQPTFILYYTDIDINAKDSNGNPLYSKNQTIQGVKVTRNEDGSTTTENITLKISEDQGTGKDGNAGQSYLYIKEID